MAEPADPLDEHLQRYALAAVAFDRRLQVVAANEPGRELFGSAALIAELHPVLDPLAAGHGPLPPTLVELADGRTLRLHGLAATAGDAAVIFAEDISDERVHDRVMREFLRNAAHQLRTPLTGITAAVEILQAGAKERPADRDRFLGHVERHAGRLSRIARGLLLLARAQTGETLTIDVVDLCPLLDEIVGEAEPRDGVDISASCPPGLGALATPDLLHEAVAALVDNAVAHTAAGSISVSAVRTGSDVVVSVADSGDGIRPELLNRIFEPFFRLGTAGGYGLGLAIAAQAVRAMRGEIGVSSAPGEGTTFTVTLRAATVAP